MALLSVFLGLSLAVHSERLVWSDEFDGNTVDRTKWDYEINCWGGGNKEQQCYVDNEDNVFVRDGVLTLKPIRIPGGYTGSSDDCTNDNENSCTWTQPCTSGRLRTLKAIDGHWLYGRFDIRARLPKGDFLWPAVWMLPQFDHYGSWAASGEIDIIEYRGQDNNIVEHTLHYGGQWPNNRYSGSGAMSYPFDFSTDFHDFSFRWDKHHMIWLVDGQVRYTQRLTESFGSMYPHHGQPWDEPFHLILNHAVAGEFFDPDKYGKFDPDYHPSTWTQDFQIDYVRVYALDDEEV